MGCVLSFGEALLRFYLIYPWITVRGLARRRAEPQVFQQCTVSDGDSDFSVTGKTSSGNLRLF